MTNFVTINADTNKMLELFNSYQALDGEQKPTNVNGMMQIHRVPFILGPTIRRALVKNIVTLRAIVMVQDEIKDGLLKELWPDAPDLKNGIPVKDFPEGVFEKFKAATNEAASHKEEIKLIPIAASALYKNDNEFPLNALSTLEENGLITDDTPE